MAKVNLATIKNWFRTGLKPTQAQFWDAWDSFRHKDEQISAGEIEGIQELLNDKADAEAFENHLENAFNMDNMVEGVVNKILTNAAQAIDGIKTLNETPIVNKLITITDKNQYYDIIKDGTGTVVISSQNKYWNGNSFVNSNNGIFLGYLSGRNNTGNFIGLISGISAGQNNTGNSIGIISGFNAGIENSGSYIGSINGDGAGQNNTGDRIGIISGYNAGLNNIGNDIGLISGIYSGQNNTGSNIGLIAGSNAGHSNTGGYIGLISGDNAGSDNTGNNIGLISGVGAGSNNIGGNIGIISGNNAGFNNTGGNIGLISGYMTGQNNIGEYIGMISGVGAGSNNTGSNIGIISGSGAGYSNAGSNIGIIAGDSTATNNTGSSIGIISGYRAGYDNTGSSIGLIVGYNAGYGNTGSNIGLIIGDNAGSINAGSNIGLISGTIAGYNNIGNNIGLISGYGAGQDNAGSFIGLIAGANAGHNNVGHNIGLIVGDNAGYSNIGGNIGLIAGDYTAYYNTGYKIVAVGDNSLKYNQKQRNTAVGDNTYSEFLDDVANNKSFSYSDIDLSDVNTSNIRVTINAHGFGSTSEWVNVRYTQGTSDIQGLSDQNIYQIKIIDANTISFRELIAGSVYHGVNIIDAGTGTGHILTPQFAYENVTVIGANAQPTKDNQVVLGDIDVDEVIAGGRKLAFEDDALISGTLVIDKEGIESADNESILEVKTIGGVKTITASNNKFNTSNPENELIYSNDFSNGTLGSLVNDASNTIDWVIETSEGQDDAYSMKSVLPSNNQVSSVSFTIVPTGNFTLLTFAYLQTMEGYPYDSLRVLIDGVERFHGDNTTSWIGVSLELSGLDSKVVTFKNYTDGGGLTTPNTAWIDNIKVYNIPQEFSINTRGSYNKNVVFNEGALVEKDHIVKGTSYLKSLVVSGEESNFAGKVVINTGSIAGGNYYFFEAKTESIPVLTSGQTVNVFRGGGRNKTASSSEVLSRQTIGIKVPGGTYATDHATDNLPYSFLSLSKNDTTSIFLSTQPKTMGASQIASRLQVGRYGLIPNQADMNTLRVYGNMLVDANEANVGTGVVGIEIVGTVVATQFKVANMNTAPASATAAGAKGDIRYTADYIYVCVATNSWKRSALTTW